MKQLLISGTILLLLTVLYMLSQPALDPEDFSGEWYSSQEQCIYLFREGLIYCQKYPVPVSGSEHISGAYTFSGNSVFLFAEGIEGLQTPKELYLFESREESLLCENADGTGSIFFVRDNRRE